MVLVTCRLDVNSFGRYVRESGKCELFSFTLGLFAYFCPATPALDVNRYVHF